MSDDYERSKAGQAFYAALTHLSHQVFVEAPPNNAVRYVRAEDATRLFDELCRANGWGQTR